MHLSVAGQRIDVSRIEAEVSSASPLDRLKKLDSLSNYYLENDPQKTLTYASECFQLAQFENKEKESNYALYTIAVAYKNLSNYDSTLHYIKKTLKMVKIRKDIYLEGLCKILLGQLSDFNGYYQEAWNNYESALICFESVKDIKNQVICYLNISYLLAFIKNYKEANEHINFAEKLLKSTFSKTEDIDYMLTLSNIYKSLGMTAKATEYLNKIKGSSSFKTNKSFQIDYYFTLGSVQYAEAKINEALVSFDNSMLIAKSMGNQRKIANILCFIANIYAQIDKNYEAKKFFYDAIKLYREIGLIHLEATTKVNLASILLDEGHADSALVLVKDFEKIIKPSEQKINYIVYLSLIGEIYFKKNVPNKAKYYFNKALDLSLEIKDTLQTANSYYSLAQVDALENNNKGSLKYLNLALPYAEASGDKQMLNDLYGFLAKTYENLGIYKNAYEFILKKQEINLEMIKDTISKQIEKVHQQNKIDFALKENLYLKRVNEQSQKISRDQKTLNYVLAFLAIITFVYFYMLNLTKKKNNQVLNRKNHELQNINQEKDQYLDIINNDLKRAADYVLSLIPKPITDKLITEWIYVPSEQLGGDSFGYHWIDDNNFAIYLIDVSGHGIKASLHTVSVINALRSHGLPNTDMTQPADVVKTLNKRFQMSDHGDMYFTLWYGVYNNEKHELSYSGCGHPPVIIMDGHCGSEIRLLDSQNLCVGGVRNPTIQSDTINIDLPTTLFVYSDGSYEIKLAEGNYWNDYSFREMLVLYEKKNKSLKDLYTYIKTLNNHKDLIDDLSILKLKIN